MALSVNATLARLWTQVRLNGSAAGVCSLDALAASVGFVRAPSESREELKDRLRLYLPANVLLAELLTFEMPDGVDLQGRW